MQENIDTSISADEKQDITPDSDGVKEESADTPSAPEGYLRDKKKTIRRAVMWAFIFMVGVFVLSNVPIASSLSIPSDVQTALTAIIIVVIGCLVGRKDMEPGWVRGSGCKMTVRAFFVILGAFAVMKYIGMGLATVITLPISLLHLDASALENLAQQKEGTAYVINVVWLGFITPFVEEFAFRGLVMQRFKRYGFRFAVIASAILFALYHSNPLQLVSTFFPGLVLGYVALRYSIWWSILLHVINNGVLIYFLKPACAATNIPLISTQGDNILCVVFIVIAAVLLIGKHPVSDVKAFFAQVPTEKGTYPLVFSNVWFVGMVVVFLGFTIAFVASLGLLAAR